MIELRKNSNEDEDVTYRVDPEDLGEMNLSELVHLCRFIGYRVDRSYSRKELIRLLKGKSKLTKSETITEVDSFRRLLSDFLQANMRILESQLNLRCNANCFEHHDAQAIVCWIVNRSSITKFHEKRKK